MPILNLRTQDNWTIQLHESNNWLIYINSHTVWETKSTICHNSLSILTTNVDIWIIGIKGRLK